MFPIFPAHTIASPPTPHANRRPSSSAPPATGASCFRSSEAKPRPRRGRAAIRPPPRPTRKTHKCRYQPPRRWCFTVESPSFHSPYLRDAFEIACVRARFFSSVRFSSGRTRNTPAFQRRKNQPERASSLRVGSGKPFPMVFAALDCWRRPLEGLRKANSRSIPRTTVLPASRPGARGRNGTGAPARPSFCAPRP